MIVYLVVELLYFDLFLGLFKLLSIYLNFFFLDERDFEIVDCLNI